ncbi:MAG: bifunctional phosphoribosylaminoimidazolecarboxamide formyltransferase/IMP cyclohydrolase [Alphaproteobacteria bacterium]
MTQITHALLSVYDKEGLIELAQFLDSQNIKILSTGGSAKAIRDANIDVTDVSEVTGFPEIFGGRVKSLHPKIHGGILARRDNEGDQKVMIEQSIAPIGLVVVNLYPFEDTLKAGGTYEELVEKIDIGGPSMLRSAAKNHADVTVISDPADYQKLMGDMQQHGGNTTCKKFRRKMAAKAFSLSASYDVAISRWLNSELGQDLPQKLALSFEKKYDLRYGENPHQKAAFYGAKNGELGLGDALQIQGKELSYNNINDGDAALSMVAEFSEPACIVVKHANPCGGAVADNIETAWQNALKGDPVSAFGGIVAFNREVTATVARQMVEIFLEVIIAPKFSDEAKEVLAAKKNLRLLEFTQMDALKESYTYRSVKGGLLVQAQDNELFDGEPQCVTKRKPTNSELKDLNFAWVICKYVKSNAILFVKNQMIIGTGAGQMSRVDATLNAIRKAKEVGNDIAGAVVASDAFYPFPDGLIAAAEAGVKAVVQPGGSIKDEDVIKAADEHDIAMLLTSMRHFRH